MKRTEQKTKKGKKTMDKLTGEIVTIDQTLYCEFNACILSAKFISHIELTEYSICMN